MEQMANGDTSIHKYNFALQFSRTIDFFFSASGKSRTH